MKIELTDIIPIPLQEITPSENSIWKSNQVFNSTSNYLIKAESGKGKSSLIAFIYGTRKDFKGEIKIDDHLTTDLSLLDWAGLRQLHLSIIFQDLRLFPNLSTIDNLLIKNELTGHKTEDEIVGMLEKLGLADKQQQLCGTLSFGQQQRVAIIRSLLQPFDFLLMDEPFSHLDEKNIVIAAELIDEEVKKNNGGILITTLGEDYPFNYDHTVYI